MNLDNIMLMNKVVTKEHILSIDMKVRWMPKPGAVGKK